MTLVTGVRLSPWAIPEESVDIKLEMKGKNSPCRLIPSDLRNALTSTLGELRRLVARFRPSGQGKEN
jgi:hypothetical protein